MLEKPEPQIISRSVCIHLSESVSRSEFIELNSKFFKKNKVHIHGPEKCEASICLSISALLQFTEEFADQIFDVIRNDPREIFYFDYLDVEEFKIGKLPEWSFFRFLGIDYLGPLLAFQHSASICSNQLTRKKLTELILDKALNPKLKKFEAYLTMGEMKIKSEFYRFDLISKYVSKFKIACEPMVNTNSIDLSFENNSPNKISVIIPTRGEKSGKNSNITFVENCLGSLSKQNLKSSKLEIIIVYDLVANLAYLEELKKHSTENLIVRLIPFDEKFNFSKKCNLGAAKASGDVFIFVNDDITFRSPNCLLELSGASRVTDVGSVGTKLKFPNGTIQHGGIILKEKSFGHAYLGLDESAARFGDLLVAHEVTGVTGACLAIERENFKKIGGWDETLSNSYNDVELCLRISQLGKINLLLNSLEIEHFGSATRTSVTSPLDMKYLLKYSDLLKHEKYLRFAVESRDFDFDRAFSNKFIRQIKRVLWLVKQGKFKEIRSIAVVKIETLKTRFVRLCKWITTKSH